MSCIKHSLWILVLIGGISCGPDVPVEERENSPLQALFDEAWEFRLREDPVFATSIGRHEYNDRLASVALPDLERRVQFWRDVLVRLDGFDVNSLTAPDRLNYDLFRLQVEDRIKSFEFKEYLMPLTAEAGFHTSFAFLPQNIPFQTTRDYQNYISRLEAFGEITDQQILHLTSALEEGYALPGEVLEGYQGTIQAHVVSNLDDSVFMVPFQDFPEGVSEGDRTTLLAKGRHALATGVIPAYQRFLTFFLDRYQPEARPSLGASELPNGEAYYRYLIRLHTTLDLNAEEVHQIGLGEVSRLQSEMQQVLDTVGFQGDLPSFIRSLRTDSRFYAKTGEQLLKEAAWIAKTMDGKLPALFKNLPRRPYTVEAVPDHIAPKYTAGRYVGAPQGSTRPGIYWVNTYALESRPLYSLTALTLHEAVPGHHLQNALRLELEDLPDFRRYSGVNAYGEGWGLYSEWLGLEAGFYTDPYDNFGRLTYEMWRACRLVVDTGLHSKGWSRQQAIDFMAANTALSLHEIGTETDRYISWPGQALAYKMGELKIKELRRRAESILQSNFDVREFHNEILRHGPLPLTQLEEQVDLWIQEAAAR